MRVCFGGLQNSNQACFNKSLFFNVLSFTSIVEPLSALFITIRGLLISSLRANLSFMVRLSCLSCLCLSVFSNSTLTLCRKVSRVPLSDNLSGS